MYFTAGGGLQDLYYPQCRLTFTPTPEEVVEIMRFHASRETERPVFSFGQGCEGEPLTEAPLLIESVRRYREAGGTAQST